MRSTGHADELGDARDGPPNLLLERRRVVDDVQLAVGNEWWMMGRLGRWTVVGSLAVAHTVRVDGVQREDRSRWDMPY